jgi:AAA domain, putative AbiEii toxin, Type IV TA system
VYWTSPNLHEVFANFEAATGFRLGLRRAVGTFEVVVAYKDGSAADYGNWSDGQKSLFSIVGAVVLQKPQVYIFDEIENYLHPAYMTYALDFLRSNVPQTVIASHHPHLIFGRTVDEVYYVERKNPANTRFATVLKKQIHQETPARNITRLANNHLKLANAYRLFDLKDSALMATAANVSDSVTYAVYDAVYHLYECHAAGANRSPFPDRQSQAVADLVGAHAKAVGSVIDWGAGLGRVLKETQKLGKGHPINSASWLLYDPNYSETDQANASLNELATRVSDRRDLAVVRADLGLLTNVLHILPASDWAHAIFDLWHATQAQGNGLILVTEIFPLLSPERNAIPIPRHLLEDFFRDLGFIVYGRDFDVQGAKSYCLALSGNTSPLLDVAGLTAKVETLWFKIERDLQLLYGSAPQVDSPATRNEILNAAFGIASIRGQLGSRLGH